MRIRISITGVFPILWCSSAVRGRRCRLQLQGKEYGPGDLVTWDLGGGVPHIGIVVDRKSGSSGRYMVVHNIGEGPRMEDVLFNWKITGHYQYFGPQDSW